MRGAFQMKKKISIISLIGILCVCVAFTYIAYAQVGGEDDPVISLSYLQQIFKPEVKKELTFEVVSVKEGESIICDAGSELILRMGTANIIATDKGGVADVTEGYDLANDTNMPSNHHLIVPVGDGRGAKALTDCLIMVKGGYFLK